MKKWILREFEHVQKHVQIGRRKNKWIIKYLEFSFISPIFLSKGYSNQYIILKQYDTRKYILNLQIALNRFGIGHTKLIQSYLISEIDSPIHKVLNLPNNHEPHFFLNYSRKNLVRN